MLLSVIPLWAGILAWILSLAFTLALSTLMARWLRVGSPSLDAAATVFCWIWLTTLMTFLTGLAGLLAALPLGILGAAGLAALMASQRTRRALTQVLSEASGSLRQWILRWPQLPPWLRWLSVGFIVFGAVRFALLIWALPPFVWDSMTYHLTNVAQWIQDGRIGLFDTPVQRIYSPANYEVLAAWFAVFLHHDVLIEAAGLPAYLLAGVSAFALARSVNLSSFAAWAGSIAYLSTPALVFAATGTKNDPFVAAIYIFLAALIVHLREDRQQKNPSLPGGVWLVLGACYALGTKTYVLQLLPGLGLLALLPGFENGARRTWAPWVARLADDLRAMSTRARLLILALVGLGIVLGGYWNVRNWILKGNPFYPYEVAIESQANPGTGSGHYGLGVARLGENLETFALKFGDKRARIVPDLPETTGWGWLAYGMGIVSSVWAFRVDRKFRILASGFVLSSLCLMASNTTSPWNMRYFVWLPALLSVGLGVFLGPLDAMGVRVRRAVASLFGLGIVMNAIMTVNYNLVSTQDLARMLALPVGERDAGRLHVRAPQEYENPYTYVPKDSLLGYNVHENGFVYPLYRADFSQRLVYVPVTADDNCEAIADAMEGRGTRYLFVAPEHTDDRLIARLRVCAASASPIRERAPGLYVVKRDGS